MAGLTSNWGSSILILKLRADGSLEWAKVFDGRDWECGFSIAQALDGGFVAAGGTRSFGAGREDILILKLGPDGNYPDCVYECPVVSLRPKLLSASPSLSVSSPSLYSSEVSLPGVSSDLTVTQVCEPQSLQELSPRRPVQCFPVSGGLLFKSALETELAIFSPDGRLVKELRLRPGETKISLKPGVYLWKAGEASGAAAVR